jgi:methanogenic corrinoid protein MtbC1
MNDNETGTSLITAITALQEETALALVRQRLIAGDDPLLIIKDCQVGLRQVGLLFERQQYYLSGLIMAGEIFREVMELVQPVVEQQVSGNASGRVLLGTVQGDIHDLGKNIVSVLLGCHNFAVHDLGIDVPPATFAEQAARVSPHVVGLSGLVASAYEAMRETVIQLRDAGYEGPIVIGGGQLSEAVCRYVGADYWATDAIDGVDLCSRLITAAG